MKDIVELLTKYGKTISTMESCTGGAVVNSITNIEGSSKVLKYSAVTYSNSFKIKMGVNKNIIDKYTVYSMETANEMSKSISDFTSSNYGVGITGQINRVDSDNITDEDDKIYVSIYDRDNNKFYNKKITTIQDTRERNKEIVVKEIINMLKEIINCEQ